jgi:hypothetical protein
MMRKIAIAGGVLSLLLGGLWLLQGLGVVHLRPILCFANCAPIQGPSTTWTIIGAVVFIGGLLVLRFSRPRRVES